MISRLSWLLTLLMSFFVVSYSGIEQAEEILAKDKRQKNPFSNDLKAVEVGKGSFRYYCAGCHGMEGAGGFRGPDLIRGELTHISDDQDMMQVVRHGIQGTQMPPSTLPDDNLWRIISFVNHLRTESQQRTLSGDWDSGKRIFFGKGFCSDCHMVRGTGGRFGPDLTGIGKTRPLKSFVESTRDPSAQFKNVVHADGRMAGGFQSVQLVTEKDSKIIGVIRNEDTYSIQILDRNEKFHSYYKKELTKIIYLDESLMPPYPDSILSDQELEDLLVFLTKPKN